MLEPEITLDMRQEEAVELMCSAGIGVVTGGAGCHRKGQGLLRADGSIVLVENVVVGERLAGYAGEVRVVQELRRGRGNMVVVRPVKGASFVVNEDHILTLVHSVTGEIIDVSVRDWLVDGKSKWLCNCKLLRQGYDFEEAQSPTGITPYVLGVFIGDGCLTNGPCVSNPDPEIATSLELEAHRFGLRLTVTDINRCPTLRLAGQPGRSNPVTEQLQQLGLMGKKSGDRFVPVSYLRSVRVVREELLAGLLDTGYLTRSNTYDYISKSQRLAEDVAFLARSLGLAAYVATSEKWCQTGVGGLYWRVSISGDASTLPLKLERKRATPRLQKKNVLRTGFSIEPYGEDNYFGFTLDGDGRYLLDDFTVTHNTGKTTVLGEALKRLKHSGVLLCAPTGKAARRMQEATGYPASTIHRALGVRGDFWEFNEDNPVPGVKTCIVDEASMVDLMLFEALLKALPKRARLILVGDANQLPSVGPGRIFADVIESGSVPVVRLETLHRAAQESWICRNGPAILKGEVPELDSNLPDFGLVDRGGASPVEVAFLLSSLVSDLAQPDLYSAQVLSPQNKGSLGTLALNQAIQGHKQKGAYESFEVGYEQQVHVGDPVVCTRNNYELGVMNGETGTVVLIGKELSVDFEGVVKVFKPAQARELSLAYALSIHRSQGSQWPWVVVVVHDCHSFMLSRQLLYTAVTRARKGVVLVGNLAGLYGALRNDKPAHRLTALKVRMENGRTTSS